MTFNSDKLEKKGITATVKNDAPQWEPYAWIIGNIYYFFTAFFVLSAIAFNFDFTVSAAALIVESIFLIVVSADALMVSAADWIVESAVLTAGSELLQEINAMLITK